MNKSSMILVALLLLTSCSKIKQLDKRTQNMDESTQAVAKTTDKLSASTDDLKGTTTTMYLQIRSKESEATRDTKFQTLTGDEADMGTRVTAAGVYFKSFEFQLWTGDGKYDTQDVLDGLYIDAANEFTRRMTDLYALVNTNKMSPTTKNKAEMSFYAVAAAMHMNHAYQEERAKRTLTLPTSFYDLVKTALRKEKNNEELKEHERILLNGINREIMIELIKARVDMTAALALKNLTDKRAMTLKEKAKGLAFEVSGGKLGTIELPETYSESSVTTKEFVETYLDASVKAKTFLAEMGVNKKLEKTIRSAFQNLELNDNPNTKKSEAETVKKKEIKSLINTLLN